MPPVPVLAVLLGFVALFAVDGLNSYLTFFPGAPHLYEPQNWLRLATGTLHGLAISFIVLPVFGFTFWRESGHHAGHQGLSRAGGAAGRGRGGHRAGCDAGLDLLLYPLAIVSSAGLLAMFTLLNGAIFLIVFRREGRGERPRRAGRLPLGVGLAMGLAEIAAAGRRPALADGHPGIAVLGVTQLPSQQPPPPAPSAQCPAPPCRRSRQRPRPRHPRPAGPWRPEQPGRPPPAPPDERARPGTPG